MASPKKPKYKIEKTKTIPKKPKKKPKKFWLGYRELVSEFPNWGVEVEGIERFKEVKKHPSDSVLQFAFLTKIIELLREIRDEAKKERKIN